jgi:hypothetical protein
VPAPLSVIGSRGFPRLTLDKNLHILRLSQPAISVEGDEVAEYVTVDQLPTGE